MDRSSIEHIGGENSSDLALSINFELPNLFESRAFLIF